MTTNRVVPRFESDSSDATALGKPLDFPFSKRSASNRFLKAALTERVSSWDKDDLSARGIPSKELITLYTRWSEGGWGQILTGNVMIHPEHLEAAGNAIIPADAPFEGPRFEAFKELATAAKAHGSLFVAQVSHPGRQVSDSIQPNPISASPVQLVSEQMGTFGVPRAATRQDLDDIIEAFAHAAEYLERAGFDGIQLHGAHGYLLSQFLSQTTNQRTDEYGGSLENRMRLILEIARAVKKRVSERFILAIKINSVEFQDKGFQPEEAVELCRALEKAEFDYVETSGGTYEHFGFEHKRESTRKRENFFIEWAAQIADALSVTKVYTTGGFKTVGGMTDTLQSVDGVGIGRASTQETNLPKLILEQGVSGIAKSAIAEDNFLGSLTGSGVQIKQIGQGLEQVDLTLPGAFEKVMASLAGYAGAPEAQST